MSKPQLDELKQRFKEQKEKKAETTSSGKGQSDYYPFFAMKDDEMAVVRTLPIANPKGIMPFIEKDHHKISIDGKDETIPCANMYGEVCPICELSKKYYKIAAQAEKDKDTEKMEEYRAKGKYYYRSRSYLGSFYIKKDPLPKDPETGENAEGKVKVIQLGNQLYKKYDTSLNSLLEQDALTAVPWALEDGLDFNIVKKNGGQWAKWDLASDFARKETSLPQSFIETFEPVDLTKYLPANPGVDKIQRMLEAHMNNSSYIEDEGIASTTPTSVVHSETKSEPVSTSVSEVEVKKEVDAEDSDSDNAEIARMLAQLKGRMAS